MKVYTIRYMNGSTEIREYTDDYVLHYGTQDYHTLRCYKGDHLEETFDNVATYSIRETSKEYDNRTNTVGAVALPKVG